MAHNVMPDHASLPLFLTKTSFLNASNATISAKDVLYLQMLYGYPRSSPKKFIIEK
jgi:hypothetical protein